MHWMYTYSSELNVTSVFNKWFTNLARLKKNILHAVGLTLSSQLQAY